MSKSSSSSSRHSTWSLSFTQRASLPDTPPLSSYLFRLMIAKRSNLCLSADVQTTSELLDVAEECGDSICVLKTHADIVSDFGERSVKGLVEIAARKRFLIFEDRKFGDIGSTVQSQYVAGPHRIASWASIVNAHIFPGPAIITSLKTAASSAIAAYNTSRTTEISGGVDSGASAASFFDTKPPSTRSRPTSGIGRRRKVNKDDDDEDDDSSEDDEDEESDEDDPKPASGSPMDIPLRPSDLDHRKPSVVSINTTISSSTEYIVSPSDTPAASPGLSTVLTERPPLARGLLILAQMSSEDNLFTPAYTAKCLELARQHRDFVFGFIAQESLNKDANDNFIVMTPGVNLPPLPSTSTTAAAPQPPPTSTSSAPKPRPQPSPASSSRSAAALRGKPPMSPAPATTKGDGQGQQYNTPRHVILDKGVDVIIVGRGILNAEDRAAEAERYRREGWKAIRERCERSR